MEGQVRSVCMTMMYLGVKDVGAVLHEIQISKDGEPLMKSTKKKPSRPDRLLFDKTQLPDVPFINCERIGSKLYLFAGPDYSRGHAVTELAYIYDAKSSGELVKFHDLPYVDSTSPIILAAHGRLYHLATPFDKSGLPMPFEVYNPSSRSWDPLPPLPQCPFVPYDEAPRWYMGYAVWGTCILVSFAYPGMNFESVIFVPVLFNAESEIWHQLNVDQLEPLFPWRQKAVVVGDTVYALGFKMGSIISFFINMSGSEEDGTIVYSLTTPYRMVGLDIIPHPNYTPSERTQECLVPLGDFFCLVQTMDSAAPSDQYQPFWITTFKIILKEGTFSKIQTLHSTLEFMSTQDYGHFWPLFCYNPDYEPKEAVLTTIRKERNKLEGGSREVNCDILDIRPREASLTNSSSCRVEFSLQLFESKGERPTIEKVDMQAETSRCNGEFLKPVFYREGATEIKEENSPGMVYSTSCVVEPKESVLNKKQARHRKKKVKHSKKKGTKRDSYIVSLVKLEISKAKSYIEGSTCVPMACFTIFYIVLLYGILSFP